MKYEVDSDAPRSPRKVIADCRAHLVCLNAAQARRPLERDPWERPPAGPSPGGYRFRPKIEGRAVWQVEGEEAPETLPDDLLLKADAHPDGRVVVRLTNPEAAEAIVDPQWEAAAWLHSMCVQAFRWELQARVIAVLEELPPCFRASAEACELHLQNRQPECAALQPAECSAVAVRVESTDLALCIIAREHRLSLAKAAEEMAVIENEWPDVNWASFADISKGMDRIEQMRDADLYPSDLDSGAPIKRRANQIAQGFKDRSGRCGGWKAFGLNNPIEVLYARPTMGVGEFSYAVLAVLNGSQGASDLSAFIRRVMDNPRAQSA